MSGDTLLEGAIALLIVAGAAIACLGSLGLARFPDFYMRLHGPGKATTLGIGCLLLAALVEHLRRGDLPPRELVMTLFVVLATPLAAGYLARAARHRRLPALGGAPPEAVDDPAGAAPRVATGESSRAAPDGSQRPDS